MARLSKYDDIFEAVNISKVFKDLKKIGIAKSIGWLIFTDDCWIYHNSCRSWNFSDYSSS